MLYNDSDKNDQATHTLIICDVCGHTFNLPNKFLETLGSITCGQCDTKGGFRKAEGGATSQEK